MLHREVEEHDKECELDCALHNEKTAYGDKTILYSKCDQACDLWQQLELASELKPDLQNTVNWGRK